MLRTRNHFVFATAIAVVVVAPLIWLQTRSNPGRVGIGAGISTDSKSIGWPYACRSVAVEVDRVTGWKKTSILWNYTSLLANVLVLLFVAAAFGSFAATTNEYRVSIIELFVLVLLVAIIMAIWTSNSQWTNIIVPSKQSTRLKSPVWAEYLIFFAVGTAFATFIRAVYRRLEYRKFGSPDPGKDVGNAGGLRDGSV